MGDDEWARIWHQRAADQEGGGPFCGVENLEGAPVHLQKAGKVRLCALWSEHMGNITVDIQIGKSAKAGV